MRHTGLPLFPRDPLSPEEPGGPCRGKQNERQSKSESDDIAVVVTQRTILHCADVLLRCRHAGGNCPLVPSSVSSGGPTFTHQPRRCDR